MIGTGSTARSGAERGGQRSIPKWSSFGCSHSSSNLLEPKLLFASCLLLSAVEDDVGYRHFAWSQTNHEHFLDVVSWNDTRARRFCFRPAPGTRARAAKRRS